MYIVLEQTCYQCYNQSSINKYTRQIYPRKCTAWKSFCHGQRSPMSGTQGCFL